MILFLVQEQQIYKFCEILSLLIHGKDAAQPDIAASLHQLGVILQLKGDFEVELQYRTSLRRRTHGEDADHPSILGSRLGSHSISVRLFSLVVVVELEVPKVAMARPA